MWPSFASLGPLGRSLGLVLVLCAQLTCIRVAIAETDLSYCGPPLPACPTPSACPCPTPLPILETETGRSLFWQDICGYGYRIDGHLFHDSCRPLWYATTQSVALFRDEIDTPALVPVVAGGTLATGSGDFDSEFENRIHVLVGHSIGDWYRVEGSWLGNFKWADTHAEQNATEVASLGFSSTLKNGEINVRRRVRILEWPNYYGAMEFSTLVGFRYMNTDESLNYAVQAPAATNSARVTTGNEMYGVQLGTLTQILFEDRGWMDLEFKAGILANETHVAAAYAPVPGAAGAFTGGENRTSLVIDLALVLNYQCSPAWTARVGYNFLLRDGIALATRNLSADANLPLINVEHDGGTIYHGPSIGLVYSR